MSEPKALTPKGIAQLAHDFLETPFGKHYMTQLSLKYNSLHQEAEADYLEPHMKAYKVERAAGVKLAIDYITDRDELLQQDYYKDA